MAAMDYASVITIIKGDRKEEYQISMNKIYSGYGIAFIKAVLMKI